MWRQNWPLYAVIVGFPLWWLLGIASTIPILVAVPMLWQLFRTAEIRVPAGFGWWLIFLVFVLASGAMLFVDAPAAVPGGSASRIVVFAYRASWYFAATVAMLWVLNRSPRALPTQAVSRLLGWMFVIVVAGGLLGVLAPTLELRSALEIVLPRSLTANGFVKTLVHPNVAATSNFLGYPQPRPLAPFPYANTWGAMVALCLPFFVASWFSRDAGWRRFAAPFVLAVAIIPVVSSLNRGLWACLIAGAVYGVIQLARRGRVLPLLALLIALALGALVFLSSPLSELLADRLENQHSNDRRSQLLVQTVASTWEGSPVVGFGNPRDIQGSFASIAGGATPDCPACGVPPLGTQGHLWMVIFSQGLVGTVFFLIFLAGVALRHIRTRLPAEVLGVCVLGFFAIQLLVYDTLGMAFYVVLLAVGLMTRDAWWSPTWDGAEGSRVALSLAQVGDRRTLTAVLAPVRRGAPLMVLGLALGGLVGTALAHTQPTTYASRVHVLLHPSPVYLHPDVDVGSLQPSTIDTEAAFVLSTRTLNKVLDQVGGGSEESLRSGIQVTAPTSTDILVLTVQDTDPQRSEDLALHLADAYLEVRGETLAQRRDQLEQALREQLLAVMRPTSGVGYENDPFLAAQELMDDIDSVSLVGTSPGEVLRAGQAAAQRNQVEVPVVSGALLGLLLVVPIARIRPPLRRRSRQAHPRATQSSPPQPAKAQL